MASTTPPYGLLELGSNSLKFYLVKPCRHASGPSSYEIEIHKKPWAVAHEFFRAGRTSQLTMDEIVYCLKRVAKYAKGIPFNTILAVATGVFRELPDIQKIAAYVKEHTKIRIRVISGKDEARLMARDWKKHAGKRSVLIFDLGGATTEWAFFESGDMKECGSLRLGAIRSYYQFRKATCDQAQWRGLTRNLYDSEFLRLAVSTPQDIVGTGGTLRAAVKCIGKDTFTREELRELIDRVIRQGAPEHLKSARRVVLLPGLLLVEHMLSFFGAEQCSYAAASVRGGMAGRLIRLLGAYRREDLHATLLLHSSQIRLPQSGS